MKIRYVGSRSGLDPERNVEIGQVFTVLQVGESYFLAIDEGGDPTTFYEDEVELVNPPLDPPTPGKPEWIGTDARDYFTDPVYANAKTIDQKVETRGQIHELRHATPEDFERDDPAYVGRIEIWASSLIGGGPIETAHLLAMNSVGVGDKLFAHFESNPNGTKYVQFRDADGTLLPFSPYYDFNSLTLERAFLRLRRGQRIVCEVTEIKAMTGTCAPASPDTTWTVYDFVADARIVG